MPIGGLHCPFDGIGVGTERTVIAGVTDDQVGPVAGRWITLLEEPGILPREEKPWIRDLAGGIVRFARAAAGAESVIFAWAF
jgi:hypothetical protein